MDFNSLDALSARLRAMRPLNETELRRLRDAFMVENTYHSNAIEGSTLTLRETALILQEGVTIGEKPLREHLEAVGHRDAFAYMVELAGDGADLTERVIRELHALVLMHDRENRGVYRRIAVEISGASHTPPPPYLVPERMERLLAEYGTWRGALHPVEAAARFHLEFEGIHPFVDGNGRTGRLLLNLELIRAGLLPVNIKYQDRRRYYDSFDAYFGEAHTDRALSELVAGYEREELEKRIALLEQAEQVEQTQQTKPGAD